MFRKHLAFFAVTLSALLAPHLSFAHEMYVLSSPEILHGMSKPAFSGMSVALASPAQFAFWATVAALVVSLVFLASISHRFETMCAPYLMRVKRYAPAVARITIGISFPAWVYYQASFGPELPLSTTFGDWSAFVSVLWTLSGILIIAGLYTRLAALLALGVFTGVLVEQGMYLLTYANYFGAVLILLILGTNYRIVKGKSPRGWLRSLDHSIQKKFAPISFLVLRVSFGISLLYASLFAKVIHNNLALTVASKVFPGHTESLAATFGFDPHFLVLGAAIVEMLIATFFILGIEIRFTALFLEFWLALSLFYFGEAVWPHIVLIGIPIAFMLYGYDRYSLEGFLFKTKNREPVL